MNQTATPCRVSTHPSFRTRRRGVAVASGEHGIAWAVATDGHVRGERFVGTLADGVAHAMSFILDGQDRTDTTVYLVLDDARTAAEVHTVLDGVPWLHLVVQAGSLGHDAYDAAAALAGRARPQRPRVDVAATPRVVVATDGSCSRRAMGYAWVTPGGRHGSGATTHGPRSPLAAELMAIHAALTSVPAGRSVHLVADSRDALSFVERTAAGRRPPTPARVLPMLTHQLAELVARRDVTVEWVRGHSGHALNEIADRLAVAARRATETRQPPEARERVTANILADLHAACA